MVILGIVLLSIFTSSVQKGISDDNIPDRFRNNVLQLTVILSNKEVMNGFGFVVGERDGILYVVTAQHVVFSDDPDVKTKEVWARFYENRGKSYKAKLLDLSYPLLDMALLEIPKPSENYKWERKYFYPHPKRNDRVWFIGRNRDWYIPTDKGTGNISKPPFMNEIHAEIFTVQPGTSGAPLLTKEGIVGMIIEDSGYDAVAVNIDTIKQVITQYWKYPWGLEEFRIETDEDSELSINKHQKNKSEALELIAIKPKDKGPSPSLLDILIRNNSDIEVIIHEAEILILQYEPFPFRPGILQTGPYLLSSYKYDIYVSPKTKYGSLDLYQVILPHRVDRFVLSLALNYKEHDLSEAYGYGCIKAKIKLRFKYDKNLILESEPFELCIYDHFYLEAAINDTHLNIDNFAIEDKVCSTKDSTELFKLIITLSDGNKNEALNIINGLKSTIGNKLCLKRLDKCMLKVKNSSIKNIDYSQDERKPWWER